MLRVSVGLLEIGGRLGLNGMTGEDGKPLYTDYADYIINHQRKPGIGNWQGSAAKMASNPGAVRVHSNWMPTSIMVVSGWKNCQRPRFYKHANQDYQDWAVEMGFDAPQPIIFQLWLENAGKVETRGKWTWRTYSADHIKEQIQSCFDPLPDWYAPFEGELLDKPQNFPIMPLPSDQPRCHSWGSQNSWLRQIHTKNPLYVLFTICDEAGLVDDDWAWVSSHHGRIKVQLSAWKR